MELLRNFRDEEGEVVIQIQRKEVEDQGDWVIVLVHDNGPGIHRLDFERVFDLHYTTKPHGCGMGLDICRTVAQSVVQGERRGYLRVRRSILLVGTTFELGLPLG